MANPDRKLAGIGDALGRSIKNFKKASTVDDEKQIVFLTAADHRKDAYR